MKALKYAVLALVATGCAGCGADSIPSTVGMAMYPAKGIIIDAHLCPAYSDESLSPKQIELRRGESCTITFTYEVKK